MNVYANNPGYKVLEGSSPFNELEVVPASMTLNEFLMQSDA